MQLKAQQDAQKGNALAGIAGGMASAFIGSDAFSSMFAGGGAPAAAAGGFAPSVEQAQFLGGMGSRAQGAMTSPFGPMAGLQGFFGAIGG